LNDHAATIRWHLSARTGPALRTDHGGSPVAARHLLATVDHQRDGRAPAVRQWSFQMPSDSRSLPDSRPPRLACLVRDHLHQHYGRVVTLAELARLTGRSPFYLSRVFRRAFGMPPYTYLARLRVQHARILLLSGHSMLSVTYTTGFSDQSHFIRHFKRVMGVTPGAYLRTMRPARCDDPTVA